MEIELGGGEREVETHEYAPPPPGADMIEREKRRGVGGERGGWGEEGKARR